MLSCHAPPRAVRTPRAFSASAIARGVVAPLAFIWRIIGRTLAAKASAASRTAATPLAWASGRLADVSGIGSRVRLLLDDMLDQWRALDVRIKALDDEFAEMARTDPAPRRLATIPGIGVINATALVAAIGDGRTFSRGRDLSAWLGLVPREPTTGGKPRLLGITMRGKNICAS